MRSKSYLNGYMSKEAFDASNWNPGETFNAVKSLPFMQMASKYFNTKAYIDPVSGKPMNITHDWGEDPFQSVGAKMSIQRAALRDKELGNRYMPQLQDVARRDVDRGMSRFLGPNATKVPGFLAKFFENIRLEQLRGGGYDQTLARIKDGKATPNNLRRYVENLQRNSFSEQPRSIGTIGRESGVINNVDPNFSQIAPKVQNVV